MKPRGEVEPRRSPAAEVELLLDLGRALHQYGTPAHRLESAVSDVAAALGLRAGVFSTPTALFATFSASTSAGGPRETHLERLAPSEVDLGKLGDVDGLAQRLIGGELGVEEARRALAEIVARPPRYGPVSTALAAAVLSASFAAILRAGWPAIALSGGCGLVLGTLSVLLAQASALRRLQELLGALVVSALAASLAPRLGATPQVVTLAGVILLVPGLTITRAFSELAQGSLVSGTSRLFGAVLSFLMLGFGVLLGGRLVASLLEAPPSPLPAPSTLPVWTVYAAVIAAGLAFTILLGAARRDLPWIVVAGLATFWISAESSAAWGPEVAAFIAALAAGVGSNAYARLARRPALIPRVPALLLLVPGSLGYRSVSSLLVQDALTGVQHAFSVAMLVVALVAGLLAAGAIFPVRGHL
ncbi:MAG TPA: threonine/serine exporter family protein [Thermoanaerobaculia bacterium]|nr:threonine/serine exporter family protein [Thermoanaerobaculia bacterium]